MSFEFGVSFSVCFLKADSLFEGSVLRVLLNPEVCKVETPGGCRVPLRALAGDSSGPRAWGQGRWALRSQVLQGFLSLLRVTVIAVGVGPLAKGLLDVHVPLRVGQTLLVAGEEAKQSLDPGLWLGGYSRVDHCWRLGYSIFLFYFFTGRSREA